MQARTDGAYTAELDTLAHEVDATIGALRDLARGLHSPALEQAGLVQALRSHVRYLPVHVAVDSRGVGRYETAVETAIYFSCRRRTPYGAVRVAGHLPADG